MNADSSSISQSACKAVARRDIHTSIFQLTASSSHDSTLDSVARPIARPSVRGELQTVIVESDRNQSRLDLTGHRSGYMIRSGGDETCCTQTNDPRT